MFHITFVHIVFISVWVTEWLPFGKELPTRLTIYSLCILTFLIKLLPVLVLRSEFEF